LFLYGVQASSTALGARSLHDIDRSPIVVAPRENRQAEANYFLFQFPGEETALRFLPRQAAALTVTLDGEWQSNFLDAGRGIEPIRVLLPRNSTESVAGLSSRESGSPLVKP
jgi:hypothetical protein